MGTDKGRNPEMVMVGKKIVVQHSLGDDTSSYTFGLDCAPIPTRAGLVELLVNIGEAGGLFREHRCAQ